MKNRDEVSKLVGINRNIMKKYEFEGIALKPTVIKRKAYYDDKAIARLWQIRFYRELGYSKEQIRAIFNSSTYDRRDALKTQISLLERRIERLSKLVNVAKTMEEYEMIPSTMLSGIVDVQEMSFDDTLNFNVAVSKLWGLDSEIQVDLSDFEERLTVIQEMIELITGDYRLNHTISDKEVQDAIGLMYNVFKSIYSDSMLLFRATCQAFAPTTEMFEDIDDIFGDGSADFLFESICFFISTHEYTEIDNRCISAYDNIERLALQNFSVDSIEVQNLVADIFDFYASVRIYSKEHAIRYMMKLSEMYGSEEHTQLFNGGEKDGLGCFLSKAIEIYCDNLKRKETEEN